MTKGAQLLRDKVAPRRITQEQLAEQLNVSQQAVSSWVHGVAKPTPERMAQIEDLLGIPMRAWAEDLPEDAGSGEHAAVTPPKAAGGE
jgi:transcriptional regulator with XRE-family HTH domain